MAIFGESPVFSPALKAGAASGTVSIHAVWDCLLVGFWGSIPILSDSTNSVQKFKRFLLVFTYSYPIMLYRYPLGPPTHCMRQFFLRQIPTFHPMHSALFPSFRLEPPHFSALGNNRGFWQTIWYSVALRDLPTLVFPVSFPRQTQAKNRLFFCKKFVFLKWISRAVCLPRTCSMVDLPCFCCHVSYNTDKIAFFFYGTLSIPISITPYKIICPCTTVTFLLWLVEYTISFLQVFSIRLSRTFFLALFCANEENRTFPRTFCRFF